jgi:hypothetical protein
MNIRIRHENRNNVDIRHDLDVGSYIWIKADALEIVNACLVRGNAIESYSDLIPIRPGRLGLVAVAYKEALTPCRQHQQRR